MTIHQPSQEPPTPDAESASLENTSGDAASNLYGMNVFLVTKEEKSNSTHMSRRSVFFACMRPPDLLGISSSTHDSPCVS